MDVQGTTVNTTTSNSNLVEAELVNTDVLHAEKLQDRSSHKGTNGMFLPLASLVILALLATVMVLMLTKRDDSPPPCYTCFKASRELYRAVTAYYEDPGPTSPVALEYEWPNGSRCTFYIRNLNQLFQTERGNVGHRSNLTQHTATFFHEDLGHWDTSSANEFQETFLGVQNLSASWGIQHWDVSSVTNMRATF